MTDHHLLANYLQKNGGRAWLKKEKGSELYIEPLNISPILLLCGANPITAACAALAKKCGFTVDVVDDREEVLTKELFPMARNCLVLPGFDDLIERLGIAEQHFVVIMTQSHAQDLTVLAQVLTSRASYLGLYGNSAKRHDLFNHLRKAGVPAAELACVHCPVGLALGAESPEQIAVSIVAELMAVRAGTLMQLGKI